ncbi:MAG TPA: hypothetical protein VHC46_01650, partial [Thermodesulfobacteriota bacterium]|nr:hypothetical protein [Thermodesulfobacteriota bacterium]
HFAFIYKKTEKLVTAIYMITNFIKDNEPLKWKIREAALSLMELNLDWVSVSLAERRELLREYRALALEIVSLSSVASHAGLISEMNFHILSREFNGLVSVIEKDENKQANEETVILDPSFFAAGEPEPLRTAPRAPEAVPEPLSAHKGQTVSQSRTQAPSAEAPVPARKHEHLLPKDTEARTSKTYDSKDSRQAIIIKLLSKKSGLGVKDFVGNIKGVSEKTIQRELLAMVASGVLKKEGERRWSTYSLAQNP